MGAGITTWLLAALMALAASSAKSATLSPRDFPEVVARVAGVSPTAAGRPWIAGKPAAQSVRRVDFHDGVPELSPYPIPPEPESAPKGDPSYGDLKDGLKALSRNQLDEAAYYFGEGRKKSPDSGSSMASAFWLGETRLRRGKFTEAMAAYAEVEGEEYGGEALYRFARLADLEQRSGESRRAWETLSNDGEGEHYAEARYRLGVAESLAGNLPEGAAHLEGALSELDPASDAAAAAAYHLAVIMRETGRSGEAAGHLGRLLLTRPDHPAAPAATALLGWCEIDLGNLESGRRRLAQVLDMPLKSEALEVRALYGMARIAAATGDNAAFNASVARLALHSDGPWSGWASADKGAKLFQETRYEEALALYRQALTLWKAADSDSVSYALGETLIRLRRFGEAAEILGAVDSLGEAAPFAWRRGAEALSAIGEYHRALKLFERIPAERPDYPDRDGVRVETAWVLAALERPEEAQKMLLRTGEGTPGREALFYVNGGLALKEGRYEEAARFFGLYRAADREGERRVRAGLSLAVALKASGEVEGAAEVLLSVAGETTDPDLSRKAMLEGGSLLLSTPGAPRGVVVLEKLVAQQPAGPYVVSADLSLAEHQLGAGRLGEALTRFEAVLKSGVEGETGLKGRLGKARTLLALGQDQQALESFQSLGEEPEALKGSAVAFGRLGRVDEMIEAVEKFRTKNPKSPELPELEFQVAERLLVAGRNLEAGNRFERAARGLDRDASEKARYYQGVALSGEGKGQEAEAIFRELSSDAGNPEIRSVALRALAAAELKSGRGTEALARLKNATQWLSARDDLLQPVLNDAGEAALALGNPTEALELLRRAKALLGTGEEELRTETLLGEALEKSGNANAALETYLRIGYHYELSRERAAAALARAVELLAGSGRIPEAREAFSRLEASQASAVWKEKAGLALQNAKGR